MVLSNTQKWLDAWGYSDSPGGLYCHSASVPATHAYRNEIGELLDTDGIIRASAVYDVDGVPAICFLEDDGRFIEDSTAIDRIREKIWNQNLISIVLVVGELNAVAVPVIRSEHYGEVLPRDRACKTGLYSRRDVESGDAFRRHAEWFAPESRVDRDLLTNLCRIVQDLEKYGVKKADAQYLMAQILFVSYLEHREIIGETYKYKNKLVSLEELVRGKNRNGIIRLLSQLKNDFNGDFLETETSGSTLWKNLSDRAFDRLADFLGRMDLETGQLSLWRYDFRYIPVELISGIYESFLSDEKRDVGAYYTPRHLANLVVDQAFADSPNILDERIYDGACGSGILLTTAYRRMLAYAEVNNGRALGFKERRELLEEHIFGSDISVSACRVTVFSLYLSMLEGLQPSDIAELQENENVKLPSLHEKNILGGPDRGDFFSDCNLLAISGRFTIFLSNPPWIEPKKKQILSSDRWAYKNGIKIPRRQTAGAFMMRSCESLIATGRVCLILPISIVAAPTSADFFRAWLDLYKLKRLINFGDLRKLLFNTARQPCLILVATPRSEYSLEKVTSTETFEYWVPKADVSLAFGRLTLHCTDRHRLLTSLVRQDNQLLTAYFWGTSRDVATITDLRLKGTLANLIDTNKNWHVCKGFHKHDASVSEPVTSEPLLRLPYLDAKNFDVDGPVLNAQLLSNFPPNIKTVARLPEDLVTTFEGPKIVFTDGITNSRSVRAAFSKDVFSFSSSIGVISGKKNDEPLLRFVAVYLHSKLAQYVLLMTAYQINFERERVTLGNIRQLPMIHPDWHVNPTRAWEIVYTIAEKTTLIENQTILRNTYDPFECEGLIFEYFGITPQEMERINEIADVIAPNLQPSSVTNLDTRLQKRPSQSIINGYARALREEINEWKSARGGVGDVEVTITLNSGFVCGPLGIVKIIPLAKYQNEYNVVSAVKTDDQLIDFLLESLNEKKLLPLQFQNNLYLSPDVLIRNRNSIYLIKPLVTRFWLCSEAYRDAERIVRHVLSTESGGD